MPCPNDIKPALIRSKSPRITRPLQKDKEIVFIAQSGSKNQKQIKVNKNAILYLQPEWGKREEMMPLMVDFIKKNPNADFCSIIYELEKPTLAIKKNFYIPLVLINLLLDIQKHFKR